VLKLGIQLKVVCSKNRGDYYDCYN